MPGGKGRLRGPTCCSAQQWQNRENNGLAIGALEASSLPGGQVQCPMRPGPSSPALFQLATDHGVRSGCSLRAAGGPPPRGRCGARPPAGAPTMRPTRSSAALCVVPGCWMAPPMAPNWPAACRRRRPTRCRRRCLLPPACCGRPAVLRLALPQVCAATHKIAVLPGDGIGPEITAACLKVRPSGAVSRQRRRRASLRCCASCMELAGGASDQPACSCCRLLAVPHTRNRCRRSTRNHAPCS